MKGIWSSQKLQQQFANRLPLSPVLEYLWKCRPVKQMKIGSLLSDVGFQQQGSTAIVSFSKTYTCFADC